MLRFHTQTAGSTLTAQQPEVNVVRTTVQALAAVLLQALEGATIFDGLVDTLSQVANFHPPAIVDALWRGLTTRPGDVAVHYAAMLAFLYGKADSTFDWSLRPLFLKFNTASESGRQAAIAELRMLIGDASVQSTST